MIEPSLEVVAFAGKHCYAITWQPGREDDAVDVVKRWADDPRMELGDGLAESLIRWIRSKSASWTM